MAVCQRGDVLLSYLPNAHKIVTIELKKLGVDVLSNTIYDEASPLNEEYGCVIDCRGQQFKGPNMYMKGEMTECVDKRG